MKSFIRIVSTTLFGIVLILGIYISIISSSDRLLLFGEYIDFFRGFGKKLETKLTELKDNSSCRKTGGKWEIENCGSACWDGYPATKSERIMNELRPYEPQACIMMCAQNKYCSCPKGKYFGSIEEGCIPNTEKQRAVR